MKFLKIILVLAGLLLLVTATGYAWSDWLTLKTDHFTVFYKPGRDAEAREVLEKLEYYRPQVEKLCGNEQFHMAFVIDDVGSLTNGFTDPINSKIHLFRHWPDDGWAGVADWWSMVGVHEYTHQLSLAKTSVAAKIVNDIFGPVSGIFLPNAWTPGWIIEGITTYSESQLTPYQGRLNDGQFDAYIAARVKDGRFPSILDGTYSPLEYSHEGIYTYGGEFINYLAQTYGREKVTRFFAVNGANIGAVYCTLTPVWGIDRSARKVFGKSFPELWQDWQRYETARYKDFHYEGEQLTRVGWDIQKLAVNGDKLYYERIYPDKTGAFNSYYFYEIVERSLTTGQEKTLVATTGNFSGALKVSNGKLYYGTYEQKTGYANATMSSFGYYVQLHQYDLATGKNRIVLGDEIAGYEVLADGQILYSKQRKDGYGSELYQYNPVDRTKKRLLTADYLIHELAGDAKRLIIVAQNNGKSYNICRLDLETAAVTPLVATPYTERWISLCGDRLFFTANYQKVSSVYCYDLNTAKLSRLTQSGNIGNAAYGEGHKELYFTQLNSFGWDLYKQTADFQEYRLPEAPEPVAPVFNLSEQQITAGTYHDNLKTLLPKSWLPVADSDQHYYGVMFMGGDSVEDFPNYTGQLVYNTEKDKLMGSFTMPVNFFAPLQANLAYSDWNDDGDEERSAQLELAYPLINRMAPGVSQLSVGADLSSDEDYHGLETTPFLIVGWQYPKTGWNLTLKAPQSEMKNGKERSAFYSDFEFKQYLPQSELKLIAQTIDDPENPDEVFTEIRGYDNELKAKEGRQFTLEYSHFLGKIRNGWWNPNVYFGDVTGTLFADQAIPEAGRRQESWGLELHVETQLLFDRLNLDCGCRFVRNHDGDNRYQIFIKTAQ